MGVAGSVLRGGLGSLLLKQFLDRARAEGAKAVLLEVRQSNLAARRLYENLTLSSMEGVSSTIAILRKMLCCIELGLNGLE